MNKEKEKCVICGKKYTEYGNNAQPVKEGQCCDYCNMNVVIPERMNRYVKQNQNK